MKKLLEIVKHEFKLTAANKTYLVMTILGPFLILAVTILPTIISMRTGGIKEGTRLGILSSNPAFTATLEQAFNTMGILTDTQGSLEDHREKVLNGENKGFLVVPGNYLEADSIPYYSTSGTNLIITEALQRVLRDIIVAERLSRQGLDPGEVRNLTRNTELDIQRISRTGETERQEFLTILFTALAFVMLLYMTILLYGQMIGRSVVVEKTSKTVEIMLSSVRPMDLLFGKLIGHGAAGLLQYTVWISVSLILLALIQRLGNFEAPFSIEPHHFGFLAGFFVLAFLLYSSAFAALGAAAEDEQHLGQLGWPLILFLVIPLVMISPIVMNPDSTFVIVLSYFPLTSPIVMFIRVLVNMPPPWEIILCVAVLVTTIFTTMFLASKIFRIGILMTGKRYTLREIIKWIRY